jgi:predicted ArsR family transcriptional regulator
MDENVAGRPGAAGEPDAGRPGTGDDSEPGAGRPGPGDDSEPGAGRPGPGDDSEPTARTVARLTDPRALRAYAHPVRMALIGLLRSEGPLTASQAAELLGESSGTCSFHLRQLAKYGQVEEAEGGSGREKPWRATAQLTDVPTSTDNPELAAAGGRLRSMLAGQHFARLTRWLDSRQGEPPRWQEAAVFGDRILYLTAEELTELGTSVEALLDVYLDRLVRPELRPEGARRVTYLQFAFPDEPRLP